MAINYKPQHGVTTYPFEYSQHGKLIESVGYAVENGGKVVTCHIKLNNGMIISGVHEQHHDVNVEVFKHLAYQQAIERLEQHGFILDNTPEPKVSLVRVATIPADETVEGQTNYNPYGAYRVDLSFGDLKIKNLDSLKVSILREGSVLAVNEFVEERAIEEDEEIIEKTTISSPFNLGTGLLEKWSWNRGAYAEGITEGFEAYIPDEVLVEIEVNGRAYSFRLTISENLEVPKQQGA